MAELGFGELVKRRDPTWASSVLIEQYDETIPAEEPDAEEPPEQLIELLRRDLDSRAVSDQDRGLLLDLAHAADLADAPLRRGRAGLTTPSVAQLVSEDHVLAAKTIRRHAADALDRLGEAAGIPVPRPAALLRQHAHRQRRGREGRPSPAVARLGQDHARHLRPPVAGL